MREIIPETYFSFSEHTQLFFYSCIAGIILGIIYDIFRAFRIIFIHNNILVMIEDILFSLIYVIFIVSFTSVFARGEFRVFYILGNILGFILYFFSIGRFSVLIIRKFMELIKFLFRPFYLIYATMNKKFHGKFVRYYENSIKHIKIFFLHLIERYKMLYNSKRIHNRKNVKKNVEKKENQKKKIKNKNKKVL